MTLYVWLLICSGPGMTGDCRIQQRGQALDMAECTQMAAEVDLRQSLVATQPYVVWCSPNNYLIGAYL